MASFIKIYQDNPNPRDIAKVVQDTFAHQNSWDFRDSSLILWNGT